MQFRKHSSKIWWSALFAFLSLILILIVITPAKAQAGDQNCVSCHTDKARLEQLSQRASQVYVDLIQYQAEVHGALQCTSCHRGDPSQNTPETACVGIAYKDPAAPEYVRETCGECHQELVDRQRTAGQPTTPSTLADEAATNPFLRCREQGIVDTVAQRFFGEDLDPLSVFTALRRLRDVF